jgi:leucyl aminopeptidase (aminopeptidase T)
MTEEQIDSMARTYTEGYRMGFVLGNKDLSKKEIVNIRYTLGFERIVKRAMEQFNEMGLRPSIFRAPVNSINKKQHYKLGYYGAIANKQYEYDHKADNAIYLDKAFVERKLGVLRVAYEKYKTEASKFAGPAVMEIFGEHPFEPMNKPECFRLDEKQQKLSVEYDMEAGQIVNEYIKGEERSFTIIAYPVPEIGDNYEEIFDEIVKINTLDYKLYEGIQQTIIDALDQGKYVVVKGYNGNKTDLKIQLNQLKNPDKETNFENCVADVNIPVGEVFTSPVLTGTTGMLHVSQVYLNELKYIDLEITFEDGKIKEYTCKNFTNEEDNKKFIKENVMYNHDTLPIGEFAIGTNTTAYMVAKKYNIADKLPILIAEKMGPHFAVGDTCYSWSEENKVYNPNKKEIVAKDNEVSILRKEDVSKAYVNCHTDITIPYEELGEITVVTHAGSEISIIKDSRFVLPGTEELNKPFEM